MTQFGSARQIQSNIQQVQENIEEACARVGRDPSGVTLVGISKKMRVEDILAAAESGLQHFGENRVEEAVEKIPMVNSQIDAPLIWHMVGHVQSRKARFIGSLFQVVHSVDNMKLAEKLAHLSQEHDRTLDILIQINVAGELQKYGINAQGWERNPDLRGSLIEMASRVTDLPGLRVIGLMTMAPIEENMEATRPVFASLAALRDELKSTLGIPLTELSMGMTDDYPVAIEEGATLIRIGRAIFGERTIR